MVKRIRNNKAKLSLLPTGEKFIKILSFIALAATVSVLPIQAQNITIDGNTSTYISKNSNITNISTSTINNSTAFNSFKTFNVAESEIVNLLLPDKTSTLVNLIKQGPSNIYGTLNSIMDGKAGGNIFLVNPGGVIVGSTGVINVGSLVVATPTTDFVNNFFDKPGVVNIQNLNALQEDTYEVNPTGRFENHGVIRALDSVNVNTGSVMNNGDITTGYIAGGKVEFNDLINTDNLENGNFIVAEGSNISIKSNNDITNSGVIAAYGLNESGNNFVHLKADNNINLLAGSETKAKGLLENSSGGEVKVLANNNSFFENGASIDVSAGKDSGDGGFIELSAENTVYAYGQFKASAKNGKAGTIYIDPDEVITNNVFTDGADFIVNADNIIVEGVIISTRNIDDPINGNHQLDLSEGDSGQLVFNTPGTIDLQPNTQIYTFADNGFSSPLTELIGSTINLDQTELSLGETRLESSNINLTNQSEIIVDGNAIFTLTGNAIMGIDNSLIATNNGIMISGANADVTINDSTLFAIGENGLNVDVDTFTINTTLSDTYLHASTSDMTIQTNVFRANLSPETAVWFNANGNILIHSEDLFFDARVSDNNRVIIEAGNDVTFETSTDGLLDLYATDINAGNGIIFDAPEGGVTILDSFWRSGGENGIDISAMFFAFVGDEADATMISDNACITINALQTVFEAGLGIINLAVNGLEADLNLNSTILGIGATENSIYINVSDGDLNINSQLGTLIISEEGNCLELTVSNDINLTSRYLEILGNSIFLGAENDFNITLVDLEESSEENTIWGSYLQAGNIFTVDAPDAVLNIVDSTIGGDTIDISANILYVSADTTDCLFEATASPVIFQANDLYFEANNGNLIIDAPDSLVAFVSPEITFETPNEGNNIVIEAESAFFFGDNIAFLDPEESLTPGNININLTEEFVMFNMPLPEVVTAFPTAVNDQITDAVTQSNLVENDIYISNTQIYANNLLFESNSNILLENSHVEGMNGVGFNIETPLAGPVPILGVVDTDIVSTGEDGIIINTPSFFFYTENRDINLTSEASNIIINSDFANIFGNLENSYINIEAGNDITFIGDHINLGVNILNPFENNFTVYIGAGGLFNVEEFTDNTLMMNNVELVANGVNIQSDYGIATIQDSWIQADGPFGISINTAELNLISDLTDNTLTTLTGDININSSTNVFILNYDNGFYTNLNSASDLNITASGMGENEGRIEISTAIINATGNINFTASQQFLIYGESNVYSDSSIILNSPDMLLGVGGQAEDPVGVNIGTPNNITITTDNLTVDPSDITDIGANSSLNVERYTLGNLYYGEGEPVDFLNITPDEFNNMWSSFIVLGNEPSENEFTNNIFLNAPLNVPNGITLYSNNSISMWPGSSIWAFSTVMNSNTVNIQDGVTLNSEIIDMTADNFNISNAIGTAVTGNSEVRIDRQTPGDFIISDTGNLKGLNSVSAVSEASRRVSLGLNSNNLENVEFGQAVNMPCQFEINAQGNITDTLGTGDANITSEGLFITANNVGDTDEYFDINLISGLLGLDLTGNAYITAVDNDVVLDTISLFNTVTNEYTDIVLQALNGSILHNVDNNPDFTAKNATIVASGDVTLDVIAQEKARIEGDNINISARASTAEFIAANSLTVTDTEAALMLLNAGNDSTFTNVTASLISLAQVNGLLNIDNYNSNLTRIITSDDLTMTNSRIYGAFIIGSENNADVQGVFYDVINANVENTLTINNSDNTKITQIQASDVAIISQGSIIDFSINEDPNIIAENINLTSIDGTIGYSEDDLNVTLTASRVDANAYGYINIKSTGDFELGNVISQTSDVRLEADNANIMADNGLITGNNIYVFANELQVSENTVIEGNANVAFATDAFTLNSPVAPAIQADGAVILSRYSQGGMIIQDNGIQNSDSRAPISLNFNDFITNELFIGNHNLTNSLTDSILINEQLVYNKNELTLSANNLIYDRNDNLPSLTANTLTLISGQDIGQKENFFDANIENTLQANAGGSIYLKDYNKDLVIDTIDDREGSIYLSTATGSIYIGSINALKQIIITAGGQIVSIDQLDPEDVIISVGDSSGTITIDDGSVSNSVDLKANTITANFTDTGNTGVSFDLSNINNTRAGLIDIVANSSNGTIFDRLFAVNSIIKNNIAGGSLIFNNANISGALIASADNISTPNQVDVNTASLTGINGSMADSIYFISSENLKVNTLRTDLAHIGTTGDILDITNARVTNTGYFSNSTKRVVLDNTDTFNDYKSIDAIFFTRDIFNLYLDSSCDIKTNANVIFIKPGITVNGSRNSDEVGKVLSLTTKQAYQYMDNAENNTFYKDYTSDYLYNDEINVFAFVIANSYNEEQNFGVTNYVLDKAMVAYRGALLNKYSDTEALQKAIDVLKQANMTKEVAQELLKSPLYQTEEDSKKILSYYVAN